jgi:hypothetical protein
MLQVVNPFGLTVYKNAKLAQFVFHELKDKVRIYVSDQLAALVVSDLSSLGRRIFWSLSEQERNVTLIMNSAPNYYQRACAPRSEFRATNVKFERPRDDTP